MNNKLWLETMCIKNIDFETYVYGLNISSFFNIPSNIT